MPHTVLQVSCTKSYLLVDKPSKQAVIIDPVKEHVNRYLGMLSYYGAKLAFTVDTHTHADHITAAVDLRKLTNAKIVNHKRTPNPFATIYAEDGEQLRFGSSKLDILYTPGHTPDHIALYDGAHVYTGDVLLIGGTGRTDFAGGDPTQSFDSITKKIFTLPDSTVVLPGHDYRGNTSSTVKKERESNPRLAGKTREQYVEIMNNLGLPLPEKIMESIQVNSAAFEDSKKAMPTYSQLAEVRSNAGAVRFDSVGQSS